MHRRCSLLGIVAKDLLELALGATVILAHIALGETIGAAERLHAVARTVLKVSGVLICIGEAHEAEFSEHLLKMDGALGECWVTFA